MKVVAGLLFIFLITAQQVVDTSPKISRKTVVDSDDIGCETYQEERCRDGKARDSDGRLCFWSPSNNRCSPAPVPGRAKIYKRFKLFKIYHLLVTESGNQMSKESEAVLYFVIVILIGFILQIVQIF